ncbi:9332_t:CDS:2, partial [Racocetra fulgida]
MSTASTSAPSTPINNIKNLAYNILKTFKDGFIKCKKITELGPCSECGNDILISPLKAFTYLICGHLFHRLCIEKKLLLTVPNTCPFPGCGKNVEILDQANPLGTVSNLPLTDSKEASQSTRISPLMDETFVLSSPPIRMERIEGMATQQVKSNLREDSPILKKLIKELSTPIPQQSSSSSIISLQTFPDMNINSVNFRELDNKIINAEDGNKKTILEVIYAYYYFGKGYRLWFDYYKKTYSEDTFNSLVNDKIQKHFPDQDKVSEANLRKKKERAIKIFKLFDG